MTDEENKIFTLFAKCKSEVSIALFRHCAYKYSRQSSPHQSCLHTTASPLEKPNKNSFCSQIVYSFKNRDLGITVFKNPAYFRAGINIFFYKQKIYLGGIPK